MPERTRVLSTRALNRALLERQWLLRRRRAAPLATVERLVALQAQVPRDPYVALWSRLEGFRPETLSAAIASRRAVRMTSLRGTLHLVTRADALALDPVVRSAIDRGVYGQRPFRAAFESVDIEEVKRLFTTLLEEAPRTRAELAIAAAERWPGRDASSLGYAMYLLPNAQVTPRGLWKESGRAAFTTLEHWLGERVATDPSPDAMLLRYLAAYGPSTVADAQAWCGVRALADAFERLRPRLREMRDEGGRELFDVPRAPLPDPRTSAPVRFLPEYDNVLLAHKDRSRIVPPEINPWTAVGWGGVLVDGMFSGRWRLLNDAGTLRVEPFEPLPASTRRALETEGRRLAAFLAPETPITVDVARA